MGGGGNRGGGSTPPPYVPPVQAPVVRPKTLRKGSYRGANVLTDQDRGTQLGTAPIAKQSLGA